MISPEISARLQAYKAKQQAGTITIEELRDAVHLMRGTRVNASKVSASSIGTKRVANAKATVDVDDLLNQLENL